MEDSRSDVDIWLNLMKIQRVISDNEFVVQVVKNS